MYIDTSKPLIEEIRAFFHRLSIFSTNGSPLICQKNINQLSKKSPPKIRPKYRIIVFFVNPFTKPPTFNSIISYLCKPIFKFFAKNIDILPYKL